MSLTPSTMLELGTAAPAFELPDPRSGETVRLQDFAGKPLLVAFICNHCPYVVHIKPALAEFAREYAGRGLASVAINANDVERFSADSPERMVADAEALDYPFPYLFDEAQSTALAYKAACTPDLFLFDSQHRLVYRGQFDASRPGNSVAVTGGDLRAAADAMLAGESVAADQTPSVGCNIKWKPGNEPVYA